jgi:uncharacterized protein
VHGVLGGFSTDGLMTDVANNLLRSSLVRNGSSFYRMPPMKELVEFMAKSLVDNPAQVHVDETEDAEGIVLSLHVAPEDMGRVIGKGGRVAYAMRILLRVAAVRQGKRVTLDIV